MTYESFCGAGQQFEQLLLMGGVNGCGARQNQSGFTRLK
jgi:hypothetical protein